MRRFPAEVRVYCQHTVVLLKNKKYKEAEKYLYNLPQHVYDNIVDVSIEQPNVDKVFKELEKHRNYVSKYLKSREEGSLQRIGNIY